MELYLVRHGEAVSKYEDPRRPLSAKGRDEVARVAKYAVQKGVKVRQIWHSGKERAKETADLLGDFLNPPEGVIKMDGLMPHDDVIPIARLLTKQPDALVVVGHLPFLAHLANYLLTGNAHSGLVRFEVGTVLCLNGKGKKWRAGWQIAPHAVPAK